MSVRTRAYLLSMAVTTLVVGGLAAFHHRKLLMEVPPSDWSMAWAVNLGSGLLGSLLSAALLLDARRLRGGQVLAPCVITLLVFFSMFPVYAVESPGASDVQFMLCLHPAEAYAAPLAILAASILCGVIEWRYAV